MSGLTRVRRTAAALLATAAAATGLLTAPSAVAAPQPIVGGTTTTASAYPFVMQITDASQDQFCGGTLVSPTKVITAAHCMVGETPAGVRVVGGRTYLDGTDGTVAQVSKIWVHPDYRRVTRGEDVAVLTLSQPMPYKTAPYVSASDTGVYAPGTTAASWAGARPARTAAPRTSCAPRPCRSCPTRAAPAPTAATTWRTRWCAPATPRAVSTPARATAAARCSSTASWPA